MPIRALLVAIEVPAAGSSLPPLPGAVAEAQAFRDWLVRAKSIDRAPNQLIECYGAKDRPGALTQRLIDAIWRIASDGRDATEELYVYFSGHGISTTGARPGERLDLLVGQDFISPETSGRNVLILSEVQSQLRLALGQGNHFYFINACRTLVRSISQQGMGLMFEPSAVGGVASVFTLQAAARGAAAPARGHFPEALMQGLSGAGRAKVYLDTGYYVTFGRLARYVQRSVPDATATAEPDTETGGQLVSLGDDLKSECRVRLDPEIGGEYTLTVLDRTGQLSQPRPMTVPPLPYVFTLKPGDYRLSLTNNASPTTVFAISEPGPGLVDLYDPRTVVFRKVAVDEDAVVELPATLRVRGSKHMSLGLEDLSTGVRHLVHGDSVTRLDPGQYEVRRPGYPVNVKALRLDRGAAQELDFSEWLPAFPREMERALRDHGLNEGLEEQLEDLWDPDPGVLLALLAAKALLVDGKPAVPGMGAALPEGASWLVVMSGLGASKLAVEVRGATSAPGSDTAIDAAAISGFDGVRGAARPVPRGPLVVAIQPQGREPVALSTVSLAGRVTLILVSEDEGGALGVRQLLIPEHPLSGAPRDGVLGFVRDAARAQAMFARWEPVTLGDDGDPATWARSAPLELDLITQILMVYELIRRARMAEAAELLSRLASASEEVCALPDFALLAKRLGVPAAGAPVAAPALVLDGALPAGVAKEPPPVVGTRFDYRGPWTLWRGEAPRAPAAELEIEVEAP